MENSNVLPSGYRWLETKEKQQPGDKFFNQAWYPVYAHHYGHEVTLNFCVIRPKPTRGT